MLNTKKQNCKFTTARIRITHSEKITEIEVQGALAILILSVLGLAYLTFLLN